MNLVIQKTLSTFTIIYILFIALYAIFIELFNPLSAQMMKVTIMVMTIMAVIIAAISIGIKSHKIRSHTVAAIMVGALLGALIRLVGHLLIIAIGLSAEGEPSTLEVASTTITLVVLATLAVLIDEECGNVSHLKLYIAFLIQFALFYISIFLYTVEPIFTLLLPIVLIFIVMRIRTLDSAMQKKGGSLFTK